MTDPMTQALIDIKTSFDEKKTEETKKITIDEHEAMIDINSCNSIVNINGHLNHVKINGMSAVVEMSKGYTYKRDLMVDIADFHEKFGLIMPPSKEPAMLNTELFGFRMDFMEEELEEFREAHYAGNLHDAFDALIDLVYVALGTAYLMGLPFNEGWDLVHKANMLKVRATEPAQSKRGTAYDVIKPEGWTAPDHQPLLDKARERSKRKGAV